MKKLIISVISLVMILSFSLGATAQEDDGFISLEDAFAEAQAGTGDETSAMEADTDTKASLLAAKSGMDASISYDRVAVTKYKQIVDTFNGVPAYYEPVTSGSDFQCSELFTRYYQTVYGSSLKGFANTTKPKSGDYVYATAAQRGKSYGHWAIIKSVSADGTKLTIIEQNWAWSSGGVVYAAKDRVIPYGGEYAGTYTVKTPIGNALDNGIGDDTNNDIGSGAAKFSDVPSNHWANASITYLANKGIINGYSNGTFLPDGNVTRAEFAKMLAIASGNNVEEYTNPRFNDVPKSQWYYTYVNWAFVNGVVTGRSSTTFDPNAKITREEIAQMLYNYSKYKGIALSSSSSVSFADKSAISNWANDAINAMYASGIITGRDNGSFDPAASASRAEAATMLHRLLVK